MKYFLKITRKKFRNIFFFISVRNIVFFLHALGFLALASVYYRRQAGTCYWKDARIIIYYIFLI